MRLPHLQFSPDWHLSGQTSLWVISLEKAKLDENFAFGFFCVLTAQLGNQWEYRGAQVVGVAASGCSAG